MSVPVSEPAQALTRTRQIRRLTRGLADFDATHRLVLSWSWELPWNKPFTSGFMHKLTEGWILNGIASFQSGNPFTLFQNNNSSELNNFFGSARPDRADYDFP